MAKKTETIVTLTDDLDGTKADRTLAFGFEGINYEIELSKKNATAFEKAIQPYIDAARKATSARRSRATESSIRRGKSRTDLADIRTWARDNGHDVSERGRIAQAVQEAYDAAH